MDSNSGHCISYSMPEQIGAIRMMILKERQIITYPGKSYLNSSGKRNKPCFSGSYIFAVANVLNIRLDGSTGSHR